MKAKHFILCFFVLALGLGICESAHRYYMRWKVKRYLEYAGADITRTNKPIIGFGFKNEISQTERIHFLSENKSSFGMSEKQIAGALELIDGFLAAYGKNSRSDFGAFRFPKTTVGWTRSVNTNRLSQQVPMWSQLLVGGDSASLLAVDMIEGNIDRLSTVKSENDGQPAYCFQCVSGLREKSLKLLGYYTNSIAAGFRMLVSDARSVSTLFAPASRQTILDFPSAELWPTINVSFVVDTTLRERATIIVLQAIWIEADERWIAVGLSASPSTGLFSFIF